ncbi:hypothetical protein CC1G_04812 [Coprinopsis cinerea okayama7|uniref:Uncharacterized protein n=1 Tax=Coprinopsis cinerea (strain Okayama-7 / 130 / ATCC MYA-4618 / FGSC 9003) TaxID=240176 RepID=A8P2N3_COPC7|nr:hypothetical protein CC1G_04812 [Coprinopsis cinerea okayama7\|eukprot:XP_001838368.2 hypothetical protein CC1G_04812 [Coprinopsis cinerea okayama7\
MVVGDSAGGFDGDAVHQNLVDTDAHYLGVADIANGLVWDSDETVDANSSFVTTQEGGNEPHGNFNTKFDDRFESAKYAGTIGSASRIHPTLGTSFDNALANIRRLQDSQAKTTEKNHLLVKLGTKTGIRVNFALFKRRSQPYDASDTSDPTAKHPVAPGMYQERLKAITPFYRLEALDARDINDNPIDPTVLEGQLIGAVVEVKFTLHHWSVHPRGKPAPTSDTFNAKLTRIRVLKVAGNVLPMSGIQPTVREPATAQKRRADGDGGDANKDAGPSGSKNKGKQPEGSANKRQRT